MNSLFQPFILTSVEPVFLMVTTSVFKFLAVIFKLYAFFSGNLFEQTILLDLSGEPNFIIRNTPFESAFIKGNVVYM